MDAYEWGAMDMANDLQSDVLDDEAETLSFKDALQHLLRNYNVGNESNTPSFMLADYLVACLDAFQETVNWRTQFRGNAPADLPVEAKGKYQRD